MERNRFLVTAVLFLVELFMLNSCTDPSNKWHVSAVLTDSIDVESMDGRLLLLIAGNDNREPRFQVSDGPGTQLVFGMDVNDWKPGEKLDFDVTSLGYPIRSLSDIPDGEYYFQVFLNRYETFNLSKGHTIKMHMDQGEGQQWVRSPGNLYSDPVPVKIEKGGKIEVELALNNVIPPIEPAKDSEFIKHVKIKSEKLTEFCCLP